MVALGECDKWRFFRSNGGLTLVTDVLLSEKSTHIIDIL